MKTEIHDYGLTNGGGWAVSEDKFVSLILAYQNERDSVKIKGGAYLQIHLEVCWRGPWHSHNPRSPQGSEH